MVRQFLFSVYIMDSLYFLFLHSHVCSVNALDVHRLIIKRLYMQNSCLFLFLSIVFPRKKPSCCFGVTGLKGWGPGLICGFGPCCSKAYLSNYLFLYVLIVSLVGSKNLNTNRNFSTLFYSLGGKFILKFE